MERMRTIRVTGKGQIRVKPDLTRITIDMSGVFPEYGDALKRSAEDTEQLKDILSAFGFERRDLKTLRFGVDTEYESYLDKNNAYQQRFAGYRYTHTMKVEFPSDNQRLGEILYTLAHCALHPEFRVSYTVQDREAAKNELLGKAVADAKEKAAVLSKSAGVTLKDIQSIDYSWGEINFEIQPMNRMLKADSMAAPEAAAGYAIDIEPDDIQVSDTVTVVWEIA